jgi:hypothetical protein
LLPTSSQVVLFFNVLWNSPPLQQKTQQNLTFLWCSGVVIWPISSQVALSFKVLWNSPPLENRKTQCRGLQVKVHAMNCKLQAVSDSWVAF